MATQYVALDRHQRGLHGSSQESSDKEAPRRKAANRELINTGTNKLFVRRNRRGTSFNEVEDVGRSLTQDRRRKASRLPGKVLLARRTAWDVGFREAMMASPRAQRVSLARSWRKQ